MKIALLSHEYPPETGYGGIGSYTWSHAHALTRLGHEVHVLAGDVVAGPLRTTNDNGVWVHRYRHDGPLMACLRPLSVLGLRWTRNRIENAVSMYQGLRILRHRHEFDIIEMPECGGEGALVNHRMRERTVVRLHSPAILIMPFYSTSRADRACCGAVEARGVRGANAVTACSQFMADAGRNLFGPIGSITVIPNGIEVDRSNVVESAGFRHRHGLPEGHLLIFVSGRLEPRKGVELLEGIARQILSRHEVVMVLAGADPDGYARHRLLPSLAGVKLRGSIHHLGHLSTDEVRTGLAGSDIFMLPSLWENCPYACLEAMVAGRAILATDQGGMPEMIVHGDNGLLARNGDVDSYVAALERLIGDASLRQQLGEAARRHVAHSFSDVHRASDAVNLYREVAA